ncbi:hypothetical protein BDV96DRAFT_574242 [Lophiotrema nucula]|uniref:Cupin 2 conserved barrel domain-containing protein n=1 Tax=Lophiotrema nucula TaxID=690887 RepID=A0A6A5ZB36_9PLEO|nr:hypothetical protein BDV96DRAFT_574242 [Lophiotrema nucula]
MASQVEELLPIALAKGCSMRIFIDHSKPEDHVDHNWTENTYDGKEGSELLAIPNHWHNYHDEVMEVLSGTIKFFVGGKEIIATPANGPVLITRGTIHGFTAIKGQQVTFTEKNIPSGDFKARFFQDLFQAGTPGLLLAFRAFYDGDTYIAVPGGFKVVDQIVTSFFGLLAKLFVPAKPNAVKRIADGSSVL